MASPKVVSHYLKMFGVLWEHKGFSEELAAIYVKYLDEIPDEQFVLAGDACIKQCRFFPTIAEIFEKAEPHMGEVRSCDRLKRIEETRTAAKKMFGG
jgi:hypothetical protein